MMWGKTRFLRALVVVVLRESREDILIMQQLFNSQTEVRNLKMGATSPLSC